MIELKDQMNNTIRLGNFPKRIISLVPSQTELLYDLGLENEVVGITKFCIHPEKWFKEKTRIGGTKTVDFEKIKALNPDLIIANKEENDESQIKELQKHYPVFISDIFDLKDSIEMILSIGKLTQREEKSNEIIKSISSSFKVLPQIEKPKTCVYLIWRDPYMASGTDTFVNDMLNRCGFDNLISGRYPELSESQLKELNPEYILLSSEPYPFKEKHIEELQRDLPNTKIRLVDGEMFSWYGSRLLKASEYFKQIIAW